jgi:Uma2 family endonuclease
VYVGSDLLIYYRQGDPSKFVVPDDFVVKDCHPHWRRTFKIWEEGRHPNVVFEITSRSSRDEDQMYKPQIYARLGVPEYFLYDPTGEYLDPPLQGFRLVGSDYVPIEPDNSGALRCEELGLLLRLADNNLVLVDEQTSTVLMTAAEAAQQRTQQLEAEVERLKQQLARETRGQ